jgi:hypothetical protein
MPGCLDMPGTGTGILHQAMNDPRRKGLLQIAVRAPVVDLVLAAVLVVQFVLLGVSIRPLALRVAQYQGAAALGRSARIAFGDQFGDFIQFVELNVPQDSRIIIPPMALDSTFGDTGLMQYFLIPREIVNCPSGEDLPTCVRSMTGGGTCILRVAGFPAQEDVPPSKVYLPFDADRGLYCPQ